MKEEESSFGIEDVFFVKPVDSCADDLNEGGVERGVFLVGVAEVGQQCVVEARVAVCQVVEFEGFDETLGPVHAGEEGGHDDHGAVFGGDPLGEVEPRQGARLDQQGGEAVHDFDGQLAGAEDEGEGEKVEGAASDVKLGGELQQPEGRERGQY